MSKSFPSYERFLNQRYELAGRIIDPLIGTLIWQNETRHLRRKQLLVLAILANAGGAFVARQTLIEHVWDGNAFVGDVGVTDTISALRRSLDDTDRANALIRTIPRGGYMLAVPVRLIEVAQAPAFAAGAEIPGKPGWQLLRALIENAVSQTWLATGPDGAQHLFRFCRNEAHLRLLQREITLLRYLRETLASRTDIAGIIDWQLDEPPYFMEMRYTAHGNLADYAESIGGLSRIALADRLRWLSEIATALAAVHSVNIVHRNISADCIFLDADADRVCAKLGEFGLGELTDRTRIEALKITAMGLTLAGNKPSGTQMYQAPEMASGNAATAASDIYALGVLLYQIAIGDLTRAPGAGWSARIKSVPLQALIAACIDPDAAQRPTSDVLSAQWQAIAASDAETPASVAAAQPSAATPETNSTRPLATMLGQSIGPYRLTDKLGEGGMGTVYLAEQRDPVQRQVAVKLVKAGMDTAEVLARFEAERQALALMNHVNVAAVYDAGATQMGRPYFAMEYVPGLEITAHCDERALDFRQRIVLFLQVCDGVLHAHQKGIIHRDLKPSNILIKTAQGQPATAKIIDFGVAKSLQRKLGNLTAHTQLGSFVGTRMYSSPEQISGNASAIDTRCDIYSLGVVLYELLTGVAPYSDADLASKSPVELTRMLSNEEPPPLLKRFVSLDAQREIDIAARRQMSIAQMKQTLGSDLSWIVAKCLERDPNARYASVLELEKDLQRWLENRPVEARPATLAYRLRKMVRRNRGPVLLGSAVAVALLFTTSAAVVGFVRARSSAAEAEAAADFQVKQLSSLNPAIMGNGLRKSLRSAIAQLAKERGLDAAASKAAQQQLDALLLGVDFTDLTLNQLGNYIFRPALATVKNDYGVHPQLQSRLWQSLADTLRSVGQNQQAVEPQALALALRQRIYGDKHPLFLVSLSHRGALRLALGQLPEAEVDLRSASTQLHSQLGAQNPETLKALHFLSAVLWQMGERDQAELLYGEVLAARQRVLGVEHPDTLKTMTTLGNVKLIRGKLDAAELLLETSLRTHRRVHGDGQLGTLNTISVLAEVYARQNKVELAESHFRAGIAGIRKLLGSAHQVTLEKLNNFAVFLMVYGRLEQAEVQFREILAIQARSPGIATGAELLWQANLGAVLLQTGRLDEADSILQDAIKSGVSLGSGHLKVLRAREVLAELRKEQGRFEEAATIHRALAETHQRASGAESVNVYRSLNSLAHVLQLQGRLDEAEPIQMQALTGLRKYLTTNPESTSPWIAESHYGGLLKQRGNVAEAQAQYRKALIALRRSAFPEQVKMSLDCMRELSQLLREQGELPEALALAREASDGARRMLDRRDHRVGVFLTEYGKALMASGLLKEAEPVFAEAWLRLKGIEGVNPTYSRDVIDGFIGLYEAWDKMEPGQGFYDKVTLWRRR